MSWFRFSSLVFVFWGIVFFGFPRFTNEQAALGDFGSRHAEDWTRIVGLLCLGFAALSHQAHGSGSALVRRVVARSVLVFSLPCALLMTYWQVIPDRAWFRLDLLNVLLLFLISSGMLRSADILGRSSRSHGGDRGRVGPENEDRRRS